MRQNSTSGANLTSTKVQILTPEELQCGKTPPLALTWPRSILYSLATLGKLATVQARECMRVGVCHALRGLHRPILPCIGGR